MLIKSKMLKNKVFFFNTLRCCIYLANNCWHFNVYEQDTFRAQLSLEANIHCILTRGRDEH